MFSKIYRLPSSVVFNNSKSSYFPVFYVKYQKNNLSHNRYGFIISTRVDKRAVVRNRTKRVLRSEIENLHAKIKYGFDFIFVFRTAITKENNIKARESAREFLKKEGLL